MDLRITIEPAYDAPDDVRSLFAAYTDGLLAQDPGVRRHLSAQHYGDELRDPAVKYGPPDGRLYLARADGQAVGCIALRRLDGDRCEMKRLYVRPEYRGRGIAGQLIRRITEDARQLGCRHLLLDTLPALEDAVRLYRKLGFYEIPCYNDSPPEATLFFQLDLCTSSQL